MARKRQGSGSGAARRIAGLHRRFVEFPVILLAVAWVGIWFLWPTGKGALATPQRKAGATTFAYRGVVRGGGNDPGYPLAFFRAAPAGLSTDASEPGADTPTLAAAKRPIYLAREAVPTAARVMQLQTSAVAAAAQVGVYRPTGGERPVFPPWTGGVMRVAAELSAPLKDCGFKVPDLPPEVIRQADMPWQAVLYVTCGPEGRPESVFLESGTPDKDLNGSLVRAMYEGASPTGAVCEGRVTISYGRQ